MRPHAANTTTAETTRAGSARSSVRLLSACRLRVIQTKKMKDVTQAAIPPRESVANRAAVMIRTAIKQEVKTAKFGLARKRATRLDCNASGDDLRPGAE